jgi:enoyl-CoA hydratase/carnithine racemase
MSDTVKVEKAGTITKLVLNRPAAYNALDVELVDGLVANLTALAGDPAGGALSLPARERHSAPAEICAG